MIGVNGIFIPTERVCNNVMSDKIIRPFIFYNVFIVVVLPKFSIKSRPVVFFNTLNVEMSSVAFKTTYNFSEVDIAREINDKMNVIGHYDIMGNDNTRVDVRNCIYG